MTYISTKKWEYAFSSAFRQWRADSHCKYLHGYALSIKLLFETNELDERNWVVDFGSLKSLKKIIEDFFDHKTIIANDDPHLEYFKQGHELGVLDLIIMNDVGCEKFAEVCYELAKAWLISNNYHPRCNLLLVEVSEHGSNSAIFQED